MSTSRDIQHLDIRESSGNAVCTREDGICFSLVTGNVQSNSVNDSYSVRRCPMPG